MAEDSPQSSSSTRWVETTQGILNYQQLAPLLASRVLRVQQLIEAEAYAHAETNEDLLQKIHSDFCADLVPEWAGQWRRIQVRVGPHQPPQPHEVPLRMRDYISDLRVRLTDAGNIPLLPELLAFAEGRLLSIHPFLDFNGRVTRLWLWELLRRLRLPPVRLAPIESASQNTYLAAIRAFDQGNAQLLAEIWPKACRVTWMRLE
jgi:CRISPR-associated endonuclease/helicase Cas3